MKPGYAVPKGVFLSSVTRVIKVGGGDENKENVPKAYSQCTDILSKVYHLKSNAAPLTPSIHPNSCIIFPYLRSSLNYKIAISRGVDLILVGWTSVLKLFSYPGD